jgi:hypothetical protein
VSTSALLRCLEFMVVCCGLQFERSNVRNPLLLVYIALVCLISVVMTYLTLNKVLSIYRATHNLKSNDYAIRPTQHICVTYDSHKKELLVPPTPQTPNSISRLIFAINMQYVYYDVGN